MNLKSRKNWQMRLMPIALLFFLLKGTMLLSFNVNPICSSCSPPIEVVKSSKTSNSISFEWESDQDVSGYQAWYVRISDGFISPITVTESAGIEFSNLSEGIYKFYFQAICTEGVSTEIIIDDLMM